MGSAMSYVNSRASSIHSLVFVAAHSVPSLFRYTSTNICTGFTCSTLSKKGVDVRLSILCLDHFLDSGTVSPL